MAVRHMEPLALWGKNVHTVKDTISPIGGIKDYVVFDIPRSMFRQAASTFSDVRVSDESARFDEIALQLFLQMLYETANLEQDKIPEGPYPYVKMWLEWIPSINHKDGVTKATGYRIHAVSFHEDIKFGSSLSIILSRLSSMHRDSVDRKMNCRKVDPLSGLFPYQKWMRCSGIEMYIRTVCDRYAKQQIYTAEMDSYLNPRNKLDKPNNSANPSNVFNIKKAMERLPQEAEPMFREKANYTTGSHIGVQTLQFPSPKHVILLTPSQVHPKVFCSKYLPDHQHWMEIEKEIPQKLHEDDYDKNCETEYDIRTPADIERDRLNGLTDRSAFASLSAQSKARYNENVLETEHTDEFPEAYRRHQEWCLTAMKHQCLDPDACISEVVSKMITWREHLSQKPIIKHRITDSTLSVFANRTITLMESYEQYYLISTAHRMMFLIHHARYDAFRRDFGLHFNCFQAGDGATSKSFLFKLMEWMSIPGTVEVLTYQTGKADAVDGNRNDITTVCHEAPPGMFRTGKNPNADSSQEAMFKEKLTSQRVTAKVWCQEESTGKRSARLTKSECVGVWMGATNDPPSEVEEALKTRFFWGNFEQQQRKGRDIDDCMNGERMMSSEDIAIRNRYFLEAKEEQYRVMIVEKAIWCNNIKDVDMTACNILLPRLKSKLTKNSIITPGPRDWERVKIFSRCMAIVTAIETVCNLPGGAFYNKVFSEEALPHIEPELKVTEEHVIFVLSLLSDQFRSPVEHKILNTIYNMEKRNPQFNSPEKADVVCHDYIKLPKLRQLSKKINSRIPLEKGRTSTNNIENFILNMAKHSIKINRYEKPNVVEGTSASADKWPVPKKKTKSTQSSAVVTHEGVFIHVSHVMAHKEDSSDSVFQILASETHQHSDSKRIITACPVSAKWFHVFRVIDRKAAGKPLKYRNVLANSKTSRWITNTPAAAAQTRTRGGYSIETDIDREVCAKWSNIVGKTCYTPEERMQRVVDNEDYIRPLIRYPETIINEWDKTQKEMALEDEEEVENSSKRKRDEIETEPDKRHKNI